MPLADLADVRLYYERAGKGVPELLFVPGWCCDHTAFQPQFERAQPRRDDRGRAGRAVPSLPSALVLVDPRPIGPAPETVEFFRDFADRLAGPDGEDIRREYVHDMGARDEEIARWIVQLMCAVPQRVAAAAIRGVGEWHGREPLARCNLPVLLLRTDVGPGTDVHRLQEIKPDLEVGITVGAGHFQQIEVPEQVNAMIERFLLMLPRVELRSSRG
ncbi:MAG TPA: alpha/beta hydrolase [Gaiellaceae bacterium]|nr:alpha/beta hydrolase [Gaiellaceae bacterium]